MSEAGVRKSMDAIMALCKRRGFVYPASEIYGGINGFWDYGPLGAQLKKNLRDAWWHDVVMTGCRGKLGPDGRPVRIVPVDTCIIQNPRVWEASGHVAGFNDPMVDCKETKNRFRADHLMGVFFEGQVGELVTHNVRVPEVGPHGEHRTLVGESQRIPNGTIVASNPQEALDLLSSDKAVARAVGLSEYLGSSDGNFHRGRFGNQEHRFWIEPVGKRLMLRNSHLVPSPFTGMAGTLTPPRAFNLMNITYTGAVFDESNKVYLRPETAQGIFINFRNVVDTMRVRVPFGIAQTGKAFRNEVTPRNFTFRSREFEQMEIEFFCHPDDTAKWYAFWRDWRMAWWESLGLAGDNLQLREHDRDELAHYAQDGAGTSDIEYRFPFTAPGFGELEGVADRTDFDLRQHQEHAGVKLDYFDTERGEIGPNDRPKGERYLPHVIEPSAGLDRGVLAVLCEAYTPDESRPSKEFMRFHPRVAPIKAAVFPLVKKDGMPEIAARLHAELTARFGTHGFIETDEKQSIGKRYARMDEAGCPFCFTVDGESVTDQTVTVRDRDTQGQERIAVDRVGDYLGEKLDS